MGIIWIILIGLVAGLIARFLSPGPNNPAGFILTVVLGIVGASLATWIGQAIGWYRPDQGPGFIGATVGAVLVLFIWNRLVAARVIPDFGPARASQGRMRPCKLRRPHWACSAGAESGIRRHYSG